MTTRQLNTHARAIALGAATTLLPGLVLAHPGHDHARMSSFMSGFTHPLTGTDHLLAMLAVGLWLALAFSSQRSRAAIAAGFLLAMTIGGALGLAGLAAPAIEPAILLSLLVFGLLAATGASLPVWPAAAVTAFFALFHGLAHGLEIPAAAGAPAYVLGYLAATMLLLAAGTALGLVLRPQLQWVARLAGAGVAACGLALMVMA